MTYCARYRFKLYSLLNVKIGESQNLTIPGFSRVTIEIGEKVRPVGHWVTIQTGGFATEDEAYKGGQSLGDMLLIVGAITGLGIDLGFDRTDPTAGVFFKPAHDRVKEKYGKELRSEIHGLTIYEDDTVVFSNFSARLSVQKCLPWFEQHIASWADWSSKLTERQRVCAALINDSFFVTQTEGQFILRISAVEALCDQTDLDACYQAAIDSLEQRLAELTLDGDIRKTLQQMLMNAKRQSLRQAYMSKFKTLRSENEAKAFDALYTPFTPRPENFLGR